MEQSVEGARGPGVPEFASDVIRKHLRDTVKKAYQTNNWGQRHVAAWEGLLGSVDAEVRLRELGLKQAIIGWALIGETHERMHASKIGQDGFIGKAWEQMGRGLLVQLNGQCGRFDQGTLDGLIRDIATVCGVVLE